MRNPGRLLLRLTHALGLKRLRETVIEPATADLEYECGEAGSRAGRAWALARGSWSVLAGLFLYAAFLPSRHVRDNWSARDAAGPCLLRKAFLPAVVVMALSYGYVGAMIANSSEGYNLPSGSGFFLAMSMVVMVTPPALAMGVGWVLSRDPRCARAALAVGFLGACFSFLFHDTVLTRAASAYNSTAGRKTWLLNGSDLSFQELTAIKVDEPSKDPPQLSLQWHMRLSLPALAWSFVWLSSRLARKKKRALIVLGIWPTYVAAVWTLRMTSPHAISGDVPVALAAWGAHVVPLTFLALLYVFRDRSEAPIPSAIPT